MLETATERYIAMPSKFDTTKTPTHLFKLLATAAALVATATGVQAQTQQVAGMPAAQPGIEYGRVISTTPVISQVAVPKQVCTQTEVVTSEGKASGAGAVVGIIAGGAAGNAIGNGTGRAAATALGMLGGALLGNAIEGGSARSNRPAQSCTTQTSYENRTTAFSVVYEFNGRQYQTQMQTDPGQWVQLQIQPIVTGTTNSRPVVTPVAPVSAVPVYAAPVAVAPVLVAPAYVTQVVTQVVPAYTQVVYEQVYAQPVYVQPAVGLGVGASFGRGHRYHHHHNGASVNVQVPLHGNYGSDVKLVAQQAANTYAAPVVRPRYW
jgi:uncharacterized protein YcfJ